MTTTFHNTRDGLCCDVCAAVVDGSEEGRATHQRWHESFEWQVIDLTERSLARAS